MEKFSWKGHGAMLAANSMPLRAMILAAFFLKEPIIQNKLFDLHNNNTKKVERNGITGLFSST